MVGTSMNEAALLGIKIRPDPKSFGLQSPDPKLLILGPDPYPPLYHTKFRKYIWKMYLKESKFIFSYTILKILQWNIYLILSSNYPKLTTFFSPSLITERSRYGQENPTFKFEDPDP